MAIKVNANLPKCSNCREFGCDAGLVNHESRNLDHLNLKRGHCLFCQCTEFKEEKI